MEIKKVVTSFLRHEGKILLMKRSEGRDFSGKWAAVSGYLEQEENQMERAVLEIKGETGIEDPRLVKQGNPIKVRDYGLKKIFIITPFLFEVESNSISLGKEHSKYVWVGPDKINNYDTVPRLLESLESVMIS